MASSSTKAYVIPVAGREDEIGTLRALILASCDIICADDPFEAYEHCVEQADVVVILICSETMHSESIDKVVALAIKSEKRVVGVWASEQEADKVPSLLHRHGSATIGLDADKVASAICGQRPIWDSPGGGPRPKPPTPRHKGH